MPARYLDVTIPFHCYLEYSSALQPCFLPSSSYQFSVSATALVYYFLILDIDCSSALFACRVNIPPSVRRWDEASRALFRFRGVPNHSSAYKHPPGTTKWEYRTSASAHHECCMIYVWFCLCISKRSFTAKFAARENRQSG